jgi:hypothetical protein
MEQARGRSAAAWCFGPGRHQEHIARPDRRGVDSLLTDEVVSVLRAQAAAGCLLCLFEDWEDDWDA